MTGSFVEIGHYNEPKHGQRVEGDIFLSRKSPEDGRIITVLSDGLGSGIKANVLATLTATMAAGCSASNVPIARTADLIMRSLPVCSERHISYATFTLIDVSPRGRLSIVEYDNPPYVLIRDGCLVEPIKNDISVKRGKHSGAPREYAVLHWSQFDAKPGDRLVVFSDGVTQSGMGMRPSPLGWGSPAIESFVLETVREEPKISARELARKIVHGALAHDTGEAKDDITAGVVYFRDARKLLVLTGPPLNPALDTEMARIFTEFPGRKMVAGGTTASIIARETGAAVKVDLSHLDPKVPPSSTMAGADLVTEGIITLCETTELLANMDRFDDIPPNAAAKAIELMLDSDIIEFVVGTKINEAHQDPNMPVELEIRRNVVKRLASILGEKYLKEVSVRFI